MKSYSKIIPIDLYARGLIICIGSKSDCVKQLRKTGIAEEYISYVSDFDMKGTNAVTFPIGGDVLIYMERKCAMDTFVHELSHAAFDICKIVGIHISEDSEEAYAYLLGYLYFKAADWFNGVPYDVQ